MTIWTILCIVISIIYTFFWLFFPSSSDAHIISDCGPYADNNFAIIEEILSAKRKETVFISRTFTIAGKYKHRFVKFSCTLKGCGVFMKPKIKWAIWNFFTFASLNPTENTHYTRSDNRINYYPIRFEETNYLAQQDMTKNDIITILNELSNAVEIIERKYYSSLTGKWMD